LPENKKHQLVDSFNRQVTYLRVSLTDQCNLRCFYCSPLPVEDHLPSTELLSYEELLRVIGVATGLGIKKIRLTGGEPLVRRDVGKFIRQLTALKGIEEVRITTNGILLAEKAAELYAAGIRKVNISLDTLKPERFKDITAVDGLDKVRQGIELALKLGFTSVKINVVAMRGINDDEFLDFARLTIDQPLQVRFIEFMPMGDESRWQQDHYIDSAEIRSGIENLGKLTPVSLGTGQLDGPARVYQLSGAMGSIGFISPISHKFCSSCNRLRLTAEGFLRACLLTDDETDLKSIVRGGGSDEDINRAISDTISRKAESHRLSIAEIRNCHGRMSRIGG
jgi:cyclic pyranopterin phosphate synthase